MEGTETTTSERTNRNDVNQDAHQKVLMSSKPLHRFTRQEPRSLGIVIVIFGCAEVLMGFQLTSESVINSSRIYIPFWQGFLFLVCGNMSIYTELRPSKKMVTVCLSMYVVSLLGIVVSVGYRVFCLDDYHFRTERLRYYHDDFWLLYRVEQVFGIECILVLSSLCVSVLLIFLCVIARLALRSTRTQLIVQHIAAPQSDTSD
uniref:uncharacterized protein n=1 Tax=Semicossyphus pulcher TaxID=241346 RepID=UPI0037E984A5